MALPRLFIISLTVLLLSSVALRAVAVTVEPEPSSSIVDIQRGVDRIPFYFPDVDSGDPLTPVIAAMSQGNIEEARRQLEPIMMNQPERALVWELDGTLKLVEGDPIGAETSLSKAQKLDPDNAMIAAKLGISKLVNGDTPGSKRLLAQAVSMQPNNLLAHRYLARIAASDGDAKKADYHYRLAAQASPEGDSTPYAEWSGYYLGTGRFREVITTFSSMTPRGRGAADVHLNLAAAYIETGDMASAKRQVEMARTLEPDTQRIPLLLALVERRDGNLDAAVLILRNALAKEPDRHLVRYELARTLVQSGDLKAGRDEMESTARRLPDNSGVRLDLARLRLATGDSSGAIEEFEASLQLRSAPEPMYELARAHARMSDLDSALATSKRLVAEFPDFVPGYILLSSIQEAAQLSQAALTTARTACQRFPAEAQPWLAYSGLLVNAARYDDAARAIEQGLSHTPNSIVLKFQLAAIHQKTGNRKAAESIYRDLLTDDPKQVASLNNLAMLLADDPNRRAEALPLARKAHTLAPASADVEDTLGWVLHLNGQNKEAEALLRSARQRNPRDANVVCRLGIVYSALRKGSEARDTIESCLAMNPDGDVRKSAESVLSSL
jgi:tetratricopeptide (TPR) repeat protein